LAERQINDGATNTTANNERRNISAFFSWCALEELIVRNPVAKTVPIKERKEKKKAFTETEIEKIRMACKTNRERAIVEMLLSTACRATEIVSVKKEDIEGNKIKVLGKGNKIRYVFLNARAAIAMELYLKERKDSNPYVFPAMKRIGDINREHKCKQGEAYMIAKNIEAEGCMDIGTLRTIVHNIGVRAGDIHAHPHKFRRTAATMALKHGMPVEQVSRMLGHEQLTTTQIYLDLSDEMLEQAHKRYVI
jgi:site-specific recombinase XerD